MGKYINHITPESVTTLLKQGLTTSQVASQLCCTSNTIRSRAAKAGWAFTKAGRQKRRKKMVQKKNGAKICTCCGRDVVPQKALNNGVQLTRLCLNCYRTGNDRGEW